MFDFLHEGFTPWNNLIVRVEHRDIRRPNGQSHVIILVDSGYGDFIFAYNEFTEEMVFNVNDYDTDIPLINACLQRFHWSRGFRLFRNPFNVLCIRESTNVPMVSYNYTTLRNGYGCVKCNPGYHPHRGEIVSLE